MHRLRLAGLLQFSQSSAAGNQPRPSPLYDLVAFLGLTGALMLSACAHVDPATPSTAHLVDAPRPPAYRDVLRMQSVPGPYADSVTNEEAFVAPDRTMMRALCIATAGVEREMQFRFAANQGGAFTVEAHSHVRVPQSSATLRGSPGAIPILTDDGFAGYTCGTFLEQPT